MSRIAINNMSFYYDDFYHQVFQNITIEFDTDWKLGMIGRNGRGKTTLLKLLSGELEAVQGYITISEPVYYFPYAWVRTYHNVFDAIKENAGGFKSMEEKMEEYLKDGTKEKDSISVQYCELLQQYYESGGYGIEALVKREFEEMGLEQELLCRDFSTLSGGEKTCMQIIALFLRKDGYILLDEPTNHLDTEKKGKLKAYLNKKKGYLLVSHDMDFLDDVTNHILSINRTDITLEQGNYTTWKQNTEYRQLCELRKREKLTREIGQLERQAEKTRLWSCVGNKQKYEFASHARTNGTRAYMRQAKRAEQNIKTDLEEKKLLLQKLEPERPLLLEQNKSTGDCLVTADDLCFSYDQEHLILKNISFRIFKGERIWLKGKNGTGKTTLCRLLCQELPSDSIRFAPGVMVTLVNQELDFGCSYAKELFISRQEDRTEEDRNQRYKKFQKICYLFDLPNGFESRPLETLSSGEQKKIEMAVALSGENHLLILDEPFNFMDANFREQLLKAIKDSRTTVIFTEHNEGIGEIATRVIEFH